MSRVLEGGKIQKKVPLKEVRASLKKRTLMDKKRKNSHWLKLAMQ